MTFRAIVIGLLLATGIAVFGYFNDWIMQQAFLATNLTPIAVYGLLVIALMLITPTARLLGAKGFSAKEWAVVVALMLVACVVPGPGLMWQFSNTLVTPHYAYAQHPGWRKDRLLDLAPSVMLADSGERGPEAKAGADHDEVVGRFYGGSPDKSISLVKMAHNVPWYAWRRTLVFWLPLLALSYVIGICLVRVVHTQWSQRERLRYPIAYVTSEIIDGWAPAPRAGIFRNKYFWMGFAVPAFILLIKGYYVWNTRSVDIPLNLPGLSSAIGNKWPSLWNIDSSWLLLNPTLYFSVVGFAYFVGSDISFSLGISGVLYGAAFLALTVSGVTLGGGGLESGLYSFQMFGSYLGLAMVILYTGRKLYGAVLARTAFLPASEKVDPGAVRAMRVALVCGAAMVAMMVFALQLDVTVAVVFLLLLGMMFVVLTRINAETGLFMIQPGWNGVGVILGIIGFSAMGPHMVVIVALLGLVLAPDQIVCLMPLAANALKIGESHRLKLPRLSRWMVVAVVVALVAGVVGTLAFQYTWGGAGPTRYGWADTVAKMPFELASRKLPSYGGDPDVRQGLDLGRIILNTRNLYAVGAGLGVVLLLSVLRLRYTWWPIHPVLFLVWGTFPSVLLAPSFFIGWLAKSVVTGFGGGQGYRAAKPVFVGLIAGEFAAGIFWTLVGVVYYLWTGMPGEVFRIFPA
jgi:hypothetical protein